MSAWLSFSRKNMASWQRCVLVTGSGLLATLTATTVHARQGQARVEAANAVEVQRVALVVGVNNGGDSRVPLRYATTDALAVDRVLREVGGVPTDQRVVLIEPDTTSLQAGFRRVDAIIAGHRRDGARVEFVFYYSGHSDEDGLLVGAEKIPYQALRGWIEAVRSDVRIAVLDSCASGAFTRLKGGTKRAPFLNSTGGTVQGHAFLASSSADEAAQESDRLGASFFTHYLVSGLRGAADVDSNGMVTLNEAFLFARDETLKRTASTQAGPQHASYDFRLAGTGDLVMTDLRQANALLAIDAAIGGRVYVRGADDRILAELFKPAGANAVQIALEPGTYKVVVDDGKSVWEATLTLPSHGVATLEPGVLRILPNEPTRVRGDGLPLSATPPPGGPSQLATAPAGATAKVGQLRWTPLHLGFVPGLQLPRYDVLEPTATSLSLGLIYARIAEVKGFAFAFGLTRIDRRLRGVQLAHAAAMAGEVHGMQAALGFAHSGNVRGMQVAIGVAHTKSAVVGAQVAVGASINGGSLEGLQAAVGGNWNVGDVRGGQAGVGLNVAQHNLTGLQVSSGINVVGQVIEGAQLGNLANYAQRVHGLQMASGVNVTGKLEGGQVSSLLNVAKEVQGLQLGIINVAPGRVKGTQIGLINYAGDADTSFALLPISKKHGVHPEIWTSEAAPFNLGLRFSARYTYGLIVSSIAPFGKGIKWSTGLGLGFRLWVRPKYELDFDLLAQSRFGREVFAQNSASRAPESLQSARLLFTWQIHQRLGIYGGPTFSVLLNNNGSTGRQIDRHLMVSTRVHRDDEVTVVVWPGFAAGVRL